MTFTSGDAWRWALALVAVIVVAWLWVSWASGSFPFGAQQTATAPLTPEQQKDVIDSLSAPVPTTNNATGTTPDAQTNPALQALTAKPTNTGSTNAVTPPVDPSILDSLSAPKK